MVQLTVRLTREDGYVEYPTVRALRSTMRQALLNGSCTRAHISADVNDADTFWYCEEWQDAGELESQMKLEGSPSSFRSSRPARSRRCWSSEWSRRRAAWNAHRRRPGSGGGGVRNRRPGLG